MSVVEKKPFRPGGNVLVVLFVVYLVLLVWAVVWKLDVPYVGEAALLPRPIKLIPFVPSAEAGASAPLEVVANFLLFVPFGVYLGLLAPTWRWWTWTGVLLGASFVLEATQHLLSTGSFDTTDIIVNTARRSRRGRAARLGTPQTPGTDRRRHDQGLPDRHRGVAARDRDLRRLTAALRTAAGCRRLHARPVTVGRSTVRTLSNSIEHLRSQGLDASPRPVETSLPRLWLTPLRLGVSVEDRRR